MIFLNPGVRHPLQQFIGPITLDTNILSPDGVNLAPVGNVLVGVSPTQPAFSGTLALTGPDAAFFSLSSSTLPSVLNGRPTTPDGRSYQLQVIATLPGAANNPFVSAMLTIITLTFVMTPAGGATIPSSTPPGTVVATMTAIWSDGRPFTGTFQFVAPNFDDHGIYAITMNPDHTGNLIINPTGPGVGNEGGNIDNVTIEAVQ